MSDDPQGYYARLELASDARPDAIHAAYRRKARVLHPDIPVTGDANAFVALKQAYDVLADPLRRGAYDRSARNRPRVRAPSPAPSYDEAEEIVPDAAPPPPMARARGPRLSDLPLPVWLGLAVVVLLAGGEAVLHLNAPPDTRQQVELPATAPTVAPQAPPPPSHPVRLVGTPNVYVVPAGTPALVLHYDDKRDAYVPVGQLPAFSAVQAVRVLRDHGLVEVRLTDTANGFIDAARLMPGNAVAARRAFCTYNAGPPPANGEVLSRHGTGHAGTTLVNRSGQPMVVKLRNREGAAVATVYLAPGSDAAVNDLPDDAYRPEYAIGELWSRACSDFAAGMRAQRLPTFVELSGLERLTLPPDLPGQAPPADIADQEFERD